jgi:hypothetical protein
LLSFSISGGTDPWSDNDRDFLDVVDSGVLVSAQQAIPAPRSRSVGQVNHRVPGFPPWASTETKSSTMRCCLRRSGNPPPSIQNIPIGKGRFARWRAAERFSDSPFHPTGPHDGGRTQRPRSFRQVSLIIPRR